MPFGLKRSLARHEKCQELWVVLIRAGCSSLSKFLSCFLPFAAWVMTDRLDAMLANIWVERDIRGQDVRPTVRHLVSLPRGLYPGPEYSKLLEIVTRREYLPSTICLINAIEPMWQSIISSSFRNESFSSLNPTWHGPNRLQRFRYLFRPTY